MVTRNLFTKMNPKSLQTLQTKALKLLVEIANSDVERSPSMRKLVISTTREILDFPFKGDSHVFLNKVLRVFREGASNLETLDLVSLFLEVCERQKKSLGMGLFSKEFSYLDGVDLFRVFFDFLEQVGVRLTTDSLRLEKFFSTLESLILKQKKPDKLNEEYFFKMWNYVCGNDFFLLKDKFGSFVVSNYAKFLHRFKVFPQRFSASSLEDLLRLKRHFKRLPGGFLSEEKLRASLGRIEAVEEGPQEVHLGEEDQQLFKLLFLMENSVGAKPNLRLLSHTLSDELFVVVGDPRDCKGFEELWQMVNFFPRTGSLQEFLVKLFRFHSDNYALFFLKSASPNLAKLDEKQLSGNKRTLVKKYRLPDKKQKRGVKEKERSLSQEVEARRVQLYVQALKSLKTGLEYDNQEVVTNMLDLLFRVLVTGKGFLGEAEVDRQGKACLVPRM